MSEAAPASPRVVRLEGAVLGAVGGPAAGFGAAYAGIGDTRAVAWAFAIVIGALLGAVSYPVFAAESGAPYRRGVGFSALFAFSVALIAGAFAAFPMGSVAGAVGGAVGGAVAALAGRLERFIGPWSLLAALALGAGAGLLAVAWWTG